MFVLSLAQDKIMTWKKLAGTYTVNRRLYTSRSVRRDIRAKDDRYTFSSKYRTFRHTRNSCSLRAPKGTVRLEQQWSSWVPSFISFTTYTYHNTSFFTHHRHATRVIISRPSTKKVSIFLVTLQLTTERHTATRTFVPSYILFTCTCSVLLIRSILSIWFLPSSTWIRSDTTIMAFGSFSLETTASPVT